MPKRPKQRIEFSPTKFTKFHRWFKKCWKFDSWKLKYLHYDKNYSKNETEFSERIQKASLWSVFLRFQSIPNFRMYVTHG